jgi:hypothetical protein
MTPTDLAPRGCSAARRSEQSALVEVQVGSVVGRPIRGQAFELT